MYVLFSFNVLFSINVLFFRNYGSKNAPKVNIKVIKEIVAHAKATSFKLAFCLAPFDKTAKSQNESKIKFTPIKPFMCNLLFCYMFILYKIEKLYTLICVLLLLHLYNINIQK